MSRLLGLALRLWPEELRERDGAVLVDTASQLIEDGHSRALTESVAIARSGLALRLRGRRRQLVAAPWADASSLMLAPLLAICLIGVLAQVLWLHPGMDAGMENALLRPGYSTLVPAGLLLTALFAAAGAKRELAFWATAAAFAALAGRAIRTELVGDAPGLQAGLDLQVGEWAVGVNADAALLPALALALICAFVLRRSGPRARLAPAGIVLALAAVAFAGAWEASASGAGRIMLVPGQAPAMFLLWLAPVLFFAATVIGRIGGTIRLAASLGLAVAGPSLSWIALGLPAFQGWPDRLPDGLLLLLHAGLQCLWAGVMLAGILSSADGGRSPAPRGA